MTGDAQALDELAALEAQARARRTRQARLLRWGSLVVAATFVFLLRADLVYAFASAQPTQLGGPLEFALGREATQTYATIAGVPGQQSARVAHLGRQLRTFGILGTNVLIVQDLEQVGPDAQPTSGETFAATGRLVRDDDAVELSRCFQLLELSGILARQNGHFYALYTGEAPRQGWGLPIELVGILVFVLLNFRAAARLERYDAA